MTDPLTLDTGEVLRQITGFVRSLLHLVGLDWTVPDFGTLCRRQRKLNVSISYGPAVVIRIFHTLVSREYRSCGDWTGGTIPVIRRSREPTWPQVLKDT